MTTTMNWDTGDIPDQTGRVIVVTGANSGIGLETARALAEKGGAVILACRSRERGEAAAARIRENAGAESAVYMGLDLGSLKSVRGFCGQFLARYDRLDLLINNAGVMIPPYGKTEDGFELQIGINHLGHFALTGLLMDRIMDTDGSRVVAVSSLAHKGGEVDFDDLFWERKKYRAWKAYCQSKLANLLFTYELQRRLELAGSGTIAVAAHPGWTSTDLQKHSGVVEFFSSIMAQKAHRGALPSLRAAVAVDGKGGEFFGPSGMFELRGGPVRVASNAASQDRDVAARLWTVSQELVGVDFNRLSKGRA